MTNTNGPIKYTTLRIDTSTNQLLTSNDKSLVLSNPNAILSLICQLVWFIFLVYIAALLSQFIIGHMHTDEIIIPASNQ